MFVRHGFLSPEQLNECLEEQRKTKEYLGNILIRKKLVEERDFIKVLAEQFQLTAVLLREQYIDWNVCLKYAALFKNNLEVLPFFENDLSVTVAIVNPLDALLISEIEKEVEPKKLKLVLVLPAELQEFLGEYKKRAKGVLKNLLGREL